MISSVSTPRSKHDLSRAILKLQNPIIETHEILESKDLIALGRQLNQLIRKGAFSVVIIRI